MGRGFQDFYDQFKQASRGAGAFIKLHTTGFAATNVQLLQNSMRLMGGRKGTNLTPSSADQMRSDWEQRPR